MEETLIDADIRKARTLPSSWYSDDSVFQTLIDQFSSEWHFAGHHSDLHEFNAIPLTHIEGQTREPMLLTKTDNGFNCLSNVCTHRGMLIEAEPCNGKVLQCPYHGRTFDLNGIFKNMPAFEDVENFPSNEDNLMRFPTGEWAGIVFTGVEPSKKFDDWIRPIGERMDWWVIQKEMEAPMKVKQRHYQK